MLFDTLSYWLFFATVLLVLATARPTVGKWLLVAASYVFYACWDVRFVLLLGVSTLANWGFGLWIDRGAGPSRKRALVAAITFNLVTLGFFKYFNFFADTLAALLHIDPHAMTLRLVLPVGISFFTFEGIAYAVDVYRRDLAARRSLLDFALFIAFFPHLIAGPIIRPVNFFPQVGKSLALTDEDARWGLREILKGLFKKVAISKLLRADRGCLLSCDCMERRKRPCLDRGAGFLDADLFRLFRLHGHRARLRTIARLPVSGEFRTTVPERRYQRILASLAYFPVVLATRLPLYPARWQPQGRSAHDVEPHDRHGTGRPLARRQLELRGLGFVPWHPSLVLHRYWRRIVTGTGIAGWVDRPALHPLSVTMTFLAVSIGWIPFRAPDFAATWSTLRACAAAPDLQIALAHPAILAIPLLSLAFCAMDRDRRLQEMLVEQAGFRTAVAAGALAVAATELFGRIDQQIPFVYFQF